MDKLRNFIAVFERQLFWALTAVLLIWGLLAWFLATGRLMGDFESNHAKAISQFDNMGQIARMGGDTTAEELPNESTIKGMESRITARRNEARQAWEKKYTKQADILQWPKELESDFLAAVKKLRPIEETVSFPAEREILTIDMRELYANYIKTELPKLAKKIGAKWSAGERTKSKADDDKAADTSIVHWESNNQNELQQEHFDWTGRAENNIPTTLEVLYAQEDLWVLTAIMEIIKNTNADAQTRHRAAVREIYFVHIGKRAMGQAGKVMALGDQSKTEETLNAGPAVAPDAAGGAAGNTTVVQNDPAEKRYVDENYRVLPAARLRGALKSGAPEDASLAVAKRIPVRMRVRMDQRKLNDLLVACGNSHLTLEVRQVRFHKNVGGLGEGANAAAAAPGPRHGGGVPGGHSGQPGGGAGAAPASPEDDPFPYDVDVELYGIVYVYNPLNLTSLGYSEDEVAELEAGKSGEPAAADSATAP